MAILPKTKTARRQGVKVGKTKMKYLIMDKTANRGRDYIGEMGENTELESNAKTFEALEDAAAWAKQLDPHGEWAVVCEADPEPEGLAERIAALEEIPGVSAEFRDGVLAVGLTTPRSHDAERVEADRIDAVMAAAGGWAAVWNDYDLDADGQRRVWWHFAPGTLPAPVPERKRFAIIVGRSFYGPEWRRNLLLDAQGRVMEFESPGDAREWIGRREGEPYVLAHNETGRPSYKVTSVGGRRFRAAFRDTFGGMEWQG